MEGRQPRLAPSRTGGEAATSTQEEEGPSRSSGFLGSLARLSGNFRRLTMIAIGALCSANTDPKEANLSLCLRRVLSELTRLWPHASH